MIMIMNTITMNIMINMNIINEIINEMIMNEKTKLYGNYKAKYNINK